MMFPRVTRLAAARQLDPADLADGPARLRLPLIRRVSEDPARRHDPPARLRHLPEHFPGRSDDLLRSGRLRRRFRPRMNSVLRVDRDRNEERAAGQTGQLRPRRRHITRGERPEHADRDVTVTA